ncbi:MAG TPA: CDP-alcohol phosphatidyltransferase family protein [Gemmatimonadota bacterium]|nr:CDP-alcohol phosphatidyltransferase family protein [Gemmatimonadota bacterium]
MGEETTQAKEGEHPGTAHDPGFLTFSNLLSLSRVPLGFLFLVVSDRAWLAVLVAGGAATDLLDGFIARVSGTVSELGALLDPFCDKVFVLIGLLSFLPGGHLDWAALLILVLRDVFTGGSYLVGRLAGRTLPFRSRLGGKLTTGLQVLTFFALLFWPKAVPLLVVLVGAASVYAIIDYGTYSTRISQARRGH